jgi:hypothetical protein
LDNPKRQNSSVGWCRLCRAFAALLAVCATVHIATAKVGWGEVQEVGGRKRIRWPLLVPAATILCFFLDWYMGCRRVLLPAIVISIAAPRWGTISGSKDAKTL